LPTELELVDTTELLDIADELLNPILDITLELLETRLLELVAILDIADELFELPPPLPPPHAVSTNAIAHSDSPLKLLMLSLR
jgi:hypothetical protein